MYILALCNVICTESNFKCKTVYYTLSIYLELLLKFVVLLAGVVPSSYVVLHIESVSNYLFSSVLPHAAEQDVLAAAIFLA